MSFEIHTRELFETDDDGLTSDRAPGQRLGWRHAALLLAAVAAAALIFVGIDRLIAFSAANGFSQSRPAALKLAHASSFPEVPGAAVQEIARKVGSPPRLDGVVVESVAPNSTAAIQGLRKGDVIIAANRKPVHTMQDLSDATAYTGGLLVLDVLRGDTPLVVLIP